MESFAIDRSLYDIEENDFKDIWDSDFNPTLHDSFRNDHDWSTILDDHPAILNDRMITDALQSPRISTDHSYSLITSDDVDMLDSPLGTPLEEDLESECFPAIPMTSATSVNSAAYVKQEPISAPNSPQPTAAIGSVPQSLLKPPTIFLATRRTMSSDSKCVLFPKVSIKVEPSTESGVFPLPPSPPPSTSSDSDGSLSPLRFQAPHSPQASGVPNSPTRQQSSTGNPPGSRLMTNSALISSQPKGATGVLSLTEEEKRTLISEGYPIPSRLPLTKSEEKSLKKIRRKIKNKISAQESRRKKKEYMDALEKKLEILAQENTEHKKKLDTLETNNTSLLLQLQRLQALLGNIPNKVARSVSTQTTTTLTVFLFCFAVFLGSWGPIHLIRDPFSFREEAKTVKEVSSVWALDKSQDTYFARIKPSRTLLAFLEERDTNSDALMLNNLIESTDLRRNIGPVHKDPAWESDVHASDIRSPAQNSTLPRHVFIKTSMKQALEHSVFE